MMHDEHSTTVQLIDQAKSLGLLYSEWTLQCNHCQAIFPAEYKTCPNCTADSSFQNIQIDFEI